MDVRIESVLRKGISQKELRAFRELVMRGNLSPNFQRCRYILKASVGEKLVGILGIEFWGNYISLRALFVDREFRKKGIGGALVRRAQEVARQEGVQSVFTYTLFWNNRFFEKRGFVRVNVHAVPWDIQQCVKYHYPHYRSCCALEWKFAPTPVGQMVSSPAK